MDHPKFDFLAELIIFYLSLSSNRLLKFLRLFPFRRNTERIMSTAKIATDKSSGMSLKGRNEYNEFAVLIFVVNSECVIICLIVYVTVYVFNHPVLRLSIWPCFYHPVTFFNHQLVKRRRVLAAKRQGSLSVRELVPTRRKRRKKKTQRENRLRTRLKEKKTTKRQTKVNCVFYVL